MLVGIKTLGSLSENIINFPEEERFSIAIMTEISMGLDPYDHATERGQFRPSEVRKLHQILRRLREQSVVDQEFTPGSKRRCSGEKRPAIPPFIAT